MLNRFKMRGVKVLVYAFKSLRILYAQSDVIFLYHFYLPIQSISSELDKLY